MYACVYEIPIQGGFARLLEASWSPLCRRALQSPFTEGLHASRRGIAHAEGASYTHMHISVFCRTNMGVLCEASVQRELCKSLILRGFTKRLEELGALWSAWVFHKVPRQIGLCTYKEGFTNPLVVLYTYIYTYAHFSLFFLQILGMLHHEVLRGFVHTKGSSLSPKQMVLCEFLGTLYTHAYTHLYLSVFFPTEM